MSPLHGTGLPLCMHGHELSESHSFGPSGISMSSMSGQFSVTSDARAKMTMDVSSIDQHKIFFSLHQPRAACMVTHRSFMSFSMSNAQDGFWPSSPIHRLMMSYGCGDVEDGVVGRAGR